MEKSKPKLNSTQKIIDLNDDDDDEFIVSDQQPNKFVPIENTSSIASNIKIISAVTVDGTNSHLIEPAVQNAYEVWPRIQHVFSSSKPATTSSSVSMDSEDSQSLSARNSPQLRVTDEEDEIRQTTAVKNAQKGQEGKRESRRSRKSQHVVKPAFCESPTFEFKEFIDEPEPVKEAVVAKVASGTTKKKKTETDTPNTSLITKLAFLRAITNFLLEETDHAPLAFKQNSREINYENAKFTELFVEFDKTKQQ